MMPNLFPYANRGPSSSTSSLKRFAEVQVDETLEERSRLAQARFGFTGYSSLNVTGVSGTQAEQAIANSAIQACLLTILDGVFGGRLELYDTQRGEVRRTRHPLLQLLRTQDLKYALKQAYFSGHGVLIIATDPRDRRNRPLRLIRTSFREIEVEQAYRGPEDLIGFNRYIYTPLNRAGLKQVYVGGVLDGEDRRGEVVDLVLDNDPVDPKAGWSSLIGIANSVSAYNRIFEFVAKFLAGYGAPTALLMPTDEQGSFTIPERDALNAGINNGMQFGRAWAIGERVETVYMPPPRSGIELENIAAWIEAVIAAAFGIHPSVANLYSGIRYTTVDATTRSAKQTFAEVFIKPLQELIAEQLTEQLMPLYYERGTDLILRFNNTDNHLFRIDTDAVAARMQATPGPAVTINEYRELVLGLEPIEGGDELAGFPQSGFDDTMEDEGADADEAPPEDQEESDDNPEAPAN